MDTKLPLQLYSQEEINNKLFASYGEALLEVIRYKSKIQDCNFVFTQEFYNCFNTEEEATKWINEFRENALLEKSESEKKIQDLLKEIQHFAPEVRRDLLLAQLIQDSSKLL